MNFKQYQADAERTLKVGSTKSFDLNHMALGLTGEAGEFADCIKKHTVYGKPLDVENYLEELGDLLWFVAGACTVLNIDMGQVALMNINKLKQRYPDKYSDKLAIDRLDK